jgi:hypothetical protein
VQEFPLAGRYLDGRQTGLGAGFQSGSQRWIIANQMLT